VKLSATLKMNVILRELNNSDFQRVLRGKQMEIVKKPLGFIWGDIVAKVGIIYRTTDYIHIGLLVGMRCVVCGVAVGELLGVNAQCFALALSYK
jgi:hypothetical protein